MMGRKIYTSIEGGLGSQIFGYMKFLHLEKLYDLELLCDISYFDKCLQSDRKKDRPELSQWDWSLDYYGIYKDKFKSNSNFLERKFLRKKYNLSIDEYAIHRKYNKYFPIASATTDHVKSIIGEDGLNFAVVHTRQGDYKNVASTIYGYNYNLNLVLDHIDIVPKRILFISDDKFTNSFKQVAIDALQDKDVLFFDDNIDQYTAHAIMRNATILFATNSTFSISAALLNEKKGICLVPRFFASPSDKLFENLNDQYSKISKLVAL